jgi:hypothetical protein
MNLVIDGRDWLVRLDEGEHCKLKTVCEAAI